MKREIITIDETLCSGCGDCIPGCPEGALQIIDGKARLVGDLFCDGLGACIGTCPQEAIQVETREAEPYDETRVMSERIIPKGQSTIIAHLKHLLDHGAKTCYSEAVETLRSSGTEGAEAIIDEAEGTLQISQGCGGGGCPGSMAKLFDSPAEQDEKQVSGSSQLTHWPIQMHLMNPLNPAYSQSDFLLAADCTAFSLGSFHADLLAGRTLGIACPKLDEGLEIYRDKIVKLIDEALINTLTVVIMEVPCCGSLVRIVLDAAKRAERRVPVKVVELSIQGEILKSDWVA